ncbi:MAG: tRNA uridine-5-carboxymethylaminomethyl(34) synthesis GTPase MnmE [Muribaculum sp.]|nr:tRNA uridine-5-carboxymethylaminomethyl(34) synthesis GTPase MnmE [Muribaculum sp.]
MGQIIDSTPTIAAIATAPGEGGIAVVRISGPNALGIADSVWKGVSLKNVASHTAHLGNIVNEDGSVLDQALATVFIAPHSFTGEDVVEFSIHGGRWLQQTVIHRLIDAGATAAQAGEFTRRAFINGRLDLAQAEGIADLIAADSKAAHRLAISQTSGLFSSRLEEIRQKMIDFAAMLELELDFSEEDVEFANREALLGLCMQARDVVCSLADSFREGRMFKEGVPVVIAGRPNAGKSTLLNAIAEDELAIVSDIPGTTRDIIETTTEINGIRFRFSDTAGLHHTDETIELQGIRRARSRIAQAAVILWLEDISDPQFKEVPAKEHILQQIGVKIADDTPIITVFTKTDIITDNQEYKTDLLNKLVHNNGSQQNGNRTETIAISSTDPESIKKLKQAIAQKAASTSESRDIVISNARHYKALKAAAEDLERATAQLTQGTMADLIAMDVRQAISHLSEITGQITTADLLQTIFSRFCIGK